MSLFDRSIDRKKLAKYFFKSTPYVPDRLEDIENAIKNYGKYEETVEWRISTVTELKVEPVSRRGKNLYLVIVKCDHEFSCHAPSMKRAAQFLRIYEQMIVDMFYALGWPSWASKTELEVQEGAA